MACTDTRADEKADALDRQMRLLTSTGEPTKSV